MECRPRHHPQQLDDRARDPAAGDHAQKKALIASERDPWRRAQFAVAQQDIDPANLVVIDEFGSNLNMTRRYARAPHGVRAVDAVPRNTPENTTTISSLTMHGIGPSMLIAGSVTTAVFEAYLEHVLAPSLRPGQIVVVDNLSAHKSPRIRELVAARDCQLWYLPPYSPDYSPIELAFAKIKAALRRARARTRAVLEDAIAHALTLISADDARAFFRHCGFRVAPDVGQWFCS
jgi:transposase